MRFKKPDRKTSISVSVMEKVSRCIDYLSEKYGVTKSEIVESILLNDMEIRIILEEWEKENE